MGFVYDFPQMTCRASPQKSPNAFTEYSGAIGFHEFYSIGNFYTPAGLAIVNLEGVWFNINGMVETSLFSLSI
jgi:hypothetical protein